MGRSPCCSKVGLKRGPWSINEDTLLTNFIQQNGEGQWRSLPKKAGLLRCGKSCRLRWMNYLRPGIKRGDISQDEEDLIVRMHGLLGNRWSLIAGRLPGRTDNEIKNYWNTYLIKKLKIDGISSETHKELPKPAKAKKPNGEYGGAATGKKKYKKEKKAENTDLRNRASGEDEGDDDTNSVPKTKVYLPKPTRVSSVFSRTNSVDSFLSAPSSSNGEDAGRSASESYAPVAWPILEMEDADFEACGGGGGGEFLGGYCVLPLPESDSSGDLITLDEVYDAYMQLL